MGKKNRIPTSQKKSEPPSSATPATQANGVTPSTAAEIKKEYDRALNAVRRGNPTKALKLLKEATPKFQKEALFHRLAAGIVVKVAGYIDDHTVKLRHLKTAVDYARNAAALCPNSSEFACFYATLLLDIANEPREYDQVTTECERALAVENPTDPAKEVLERDDTVSFTAEAKEARVLEVNIELKNVLQRANIANISSWMKNLSGGNGEDRIKLVPMVRRATFDDNGEIKFITGNGIARRPNEIKKSSKSLEDKRKDIEVQVAAARLLQQKSQQEALEDSKSRGVGTSTSTSSTSTSSILVLSNNRSAVASGTGTGTATVAARRRHAGSRRNASISERSDQVRSFWNSMSFEMKSGLLNVRVCNLRAHFCGSSFKDGGQVCEILSEALAFGEKNQTWKFWACFRCGNKFADASAHIRHVIQEHLDNLLSKVQHLLPQCVDSEWEEMLINCYWKPLDLTASVRMLEDRSKPVVPEISDGEIRNELMEDSWSDSFGPEETCVLSQENKSLEDDCSDSLWEITDSNIEHGTCDKLNVCTVYNPKYSWPLSDDAERARLLERISSILQALLREKCLGVTHFQKVMEYTFSELQGLSPDSRILSSGVDKTPLCICFLGASSLSKIVEYLETISCASSRGSFADKVSPDNSSTWLQVLDCDSEDSIQLDENASSLILDESLLHAETVNGVIEDVNSGTSVDGFRKGSQCEFDPLLSWIYSGLPSAEQLATWSRLREEKSQEGMQLLEMLRKEFIQLQTLCQKKQEILGHGEALQRVEDLGLEECKNREQVTEMSYRILQKHRDELLEGDKEVMFQSNRWESNAISKVLKEAECLYKLKGHNGGEVDLEAGKEDQSLKELLDRCTSIVYHREKENISTELGQLDGQVLRRLFNIKQLERQLEPVAGHDYRIILLPLVKSYMRAHLEDLVEKDAIEKSDAARDAFLAELALDSKKKTGGGNDHGKNTQEKMKDRKKNKDSRRCKDSKLGGFNDQLEADQSSLAAPSDGEVVDSEIMEPESDGSIRESEDEARRRCELEEEERKLEETLEYQRRLENEAKQRILAEKRRKNALVASEDAFDKPSDVFVGIPGASFCKQEALPWKNVNSVNLNSSKDDFCSRVADEASVGSTNCYLEPGLPSSGGPNDGVLPFERQAGKRGKRRNSVKGPEGTYQTVSYGIENVVNSAIHTDQKEQVSNWNGFSNQSVGDSGSKTLRQLQAEEDAEERYQADLKKALMQSLEYQARPKMRSQDFDNFGNATDGVRGENVSELDLVGLGLQNEVGEYNCFLNVIIQSLWHLRRFREEFLRRSPSEHVHVGDPCVVCALFDILAALSMASGVAKREPVAPSTLRIALSKLCPNSNFFQEAQMNDASEVLAVIFDCLHQSFTSPPSGCNGNSVESDRMGPWDCSSSSCIAHTLFGMNILERMNCFNCGLESRHLKYTSFFHNINAGALRTMKDCSVDNEFDEILNIVQSNHLVACDPEALGCGRLNHIHHILSNPPHVFTAVLGWQNTCESLDNIKETLSILSTEIDISKLYRGLDPQNQHRLVSVVCYYGQHYHCFAFSHEHNKWIMYDDKTVKVVGSWEDILSMCERGHLQPQVLFYEAVN